MLLYVSLPLAALLLLSSVLFLCFKVKRRRRDYPATNGSASRGANDVHKRSNGGANGVRGSAAVAPRYQRPPRPSYEKLERSDPDETDKDFTVVEISVPGGTAGTAAASGCGTRSGKSAADSGNGRSGVEQVGRFTVEGSVDDRALSSGEEQPLSSGEPAEDAPLSAGDDDGAALEISGVEIQEQEEESALLNGAENDNCDENAENDENGENDENADDDKDDDLDENEVEDELKELTNRSTNELANPSNQTTVRSANELTRRSLYQSGNISTNETGHGTRLDNYSTMHSMMTPSLVAEMIAHANKVKKAEGHPSKTIDHDRQQKRKHDSGNHHHHHNHEETSRGRRHSKTSHPSGKPPAHPERKHSKTGQTKEQSGNAKPSTARKRSDVASQPHPRERSREPTNGHRSNRERGKTKHPPPKPGEIVSCVTRGRQDAAEQHKRQQRILKERQEYEKRKRKDEEKRKRDAEKREEEAKKKRERRQLKERERENERRRKEAREMEKRRNREEHQSQLRLVLQHFQQQQQQLSPTGRQSPLGLSKGYAADADDRTRHWLETMRTSTASLSSLERAVGSGPREAVGGEAEA